MVKILELRIYLFSSLVEKVLESRIMNLVLFLVGSFIGGVHFWGFGDFVRSFSNVEDEILLIVKKSKCFPRYIFSSYFGLSYPKDSEVETYD